jgi:hypothetical protein
MRQPSSSLLHGHGSQLLLAHGGEEGKGARPGQRRHTARHRTTRRWPAAACTAARGGHKEQAEVVSGEHRRGCCGRGSAPRGVWAGSRCPWDTGEGGTRARGGSDREIGAAAELSSMAAAVASGGAGRGGRARVGAMQQQGVRVVHGDGFIEGEGRRGKLFQAAKDGGSPEKLLLARLLAPRRVPPPKKVLPARLLAPCRVSCAAAAGCWPGFLPLRA